MNQTPDESPAIPEPPAGGRLLIVGDRRAGRRVARYLGDGAWTGHAVVGFIDAGHSGLSGRKGGRQLAVHPQAAPVRVLGQVDRIADWVERVRATDVVVTLSGQPARRLRPAIDGIGRDDLRVHWVSRPATPRGRDARRTRSMLREGGGWQFDRAAKRLVDIAASGLGLVLLAPLFLVTSLLILLSTGRPIFYTQERVGRGGRLFRIIKFRSMRLDAEGSTGPIWASNGDDRCTRIGAWLRRTNIDELPQLLNVLRGDMSLVGPRPERPMFVEDFTAAMPDYDLRHSVPGGMTGWAQVHGWRGRTSLRKRIQYDLNYIQRWSFWFDFKVLYMTVQHVACRKTSWPAPRPSRWRWRRRRPA